MRWETLNRTLYTVVVRKINLVFMTYFSLFLKTIKNKDDLFTYVMHHLK